MLVIEKNYLETYAEKARQLEKQIQQTTTTTKLSELAHEIATYHRILSAYLMSSNQPDKEILGELLQKFSQIETEVLIKFYGRVSSSPTNKVL
ncbi:MAG: hypothetical protein IPK14_08165 [Blastocatellia bacterium]|nr:hypothetical protein [Blastocatellia bacterium]MBN8723833.1 hypothetical protein [Acidobacteriota bacterium]